jgi:hypothetical protein
MRCKRICRELLWLARFGEFGPSSAPHLEHLASCGGCRDEVGFDRALVQQLRVALAERIASEEPSSGAWGVILARTQAPEQGFGDFLRGHAAGLASRLRTATAVTAVALAGIIATSTQVAITHPEAGSAETEVRQDLQGLDERFQLRPLVPRPRQIATPVVYVPAAAPRDPEAAFLVSASLPVSASPAPDEVASEDEPTVEAVVVIVAPFSRLTPADPVDSTDAPAPYVAPESDDAPAGEPY